MDPSSFLESVWGFWELAVPSEDWGLTNDPPQHLPCHFDTEHDDDAGEQGMDYIVDPIIYMIFRQSQVKSSSYRCFSP